MCLLLEFIKVSAKEQIFCADAQTPAWLYILFREKKSLTYKFQEGKCMKRDGTIFGMEKKGLTCVSGKCNCLQHHFKPFLHHVNLTEHDLLFCQLEGYCKKLLAK